MLHSSVRAAYVSVDSLLGNRARIPLACSWIYTTLVERTSDMCGSSFDQGFPHAANDCNAQRSQAIGIVCSDNVARWQHGVVWCDVRCVFGSLLDGFHFFFASSVVEWTYHDGLS